MKNFLNNIFYKKCILCCSKQEKSLCKTCSKQIKNFKKDFDKFICSKPVYSAFYYKNEIQFNDKMLAKNIYANFGERTQLYTVLKLTDLAYFDKYFV